MNVYQSWIPETKSVQINECLSIMNTWNQFCPDQWMFINHEYLKPVLSKFAWWGKIISGIWRRKIPPGANTNYQSSKNFVSILFQSSHLLFRCCFFAQCQALKKNSMTKKKQGKSFSCFKNFSLVRNVVHCARNHLTISGFRGKKDIWPWVHGLIFSPSQGTLTYPPNPNPPPPPPPPPTFNVWPGSPLFSIPLNAVSHKTHTKAWVTHQCPVHGVRSVASESPQQYQSSHLMSLTASTGDTR